jgi:O-antigen ligase
MEKTLSALWLEKWRIQNLEVWILGFIFVFVVGLFNEHLTAVRNLGLYSALVLVIIKSVRHRQDVAATARVVISDTQLPVILLLCFLCSILFSSLFPYTQDLESLTSLVDETRIMIVFFLIVMGVTDRAKLLNIIVYAMVTAMALCAWHFVAKDLPELSRLDASFRVSRNYALYFEFLFPFVFYQLFIEKNLWGKAVIAVVLLFSSLTLVLSGVRGSWLAAGTESLIVLAYVIYFHRSELKRFVPYLLAGVLALSSFLFYALSSTNVVRSAFERGVSLTGRDTIVKERLPIFIEHGDLVFGLGHGGAQYHKFMNDYGAPKTIGRYENGVFIFNRDEPYVLQLFLHFGLMGLLFAIILFGYLIFDLLRLNKSAGWYGVPVLSAFIGVFVVRGLFEGRYLGTLLFLIILYLVQRSLVIDARNESNEVDVKSVS